MATICVLLSLSLSVRSALVLTFRNVSRNMMLPFLGLGNEEGNTQPRYQQWKHFKVGDDTNLICIRVVRTREHANHDSLEYWYSVTVVPQDGCAVSWRSLINVTLIPTHMLSH